MLCWRCLLLRGIYVLSRLVRTRRRCARGRRGAWALTTWGLQHCVDNAGSGRAVVFFGLRRQRFVCWILRLLCEVLFVEGVRAGSLFVETSLALLALLIKRSTRAFFLSSYRFCLAVLFASSSAVRLASCFLISSDTTPCCSGCDDSLAWMWG